jgi:hypothetical protein
LNTADFILSNAGSKAGLVWTASGVMQGGKPLTALARATAACVLCASSLLGASPLLGAGAPPAGAGSARPPPVSADLISGNTLSAVVYVGPGAAASGGAGLSRFVLQAYFRAAGSASVRVWSAARDAYTAPVERRWTLSGSRLCLGAPPPGPVRLCADIHIWGPRIAGVGTAPYVMLDGDLTPGNALLATR